MKHQIVFTLTALLLLFVLPGIAQKDTSVKKQNGIVDSLKPFNEVITKNAVTKKGLVTIHKVGDKYYFEISNDLLGKDLLIITRMSRGTVRLSFFGFNFYPGDEIGSTVVKLEKGPANKLLIRQELFTNFSGDSSAPMFNAVQRSNFPAIIGTLPVVALSPDSSGVVVDMTDYILSDNELFSFDNSLKPEFNLASFVKESSFINNIQSFPLNVEINTVQTFLQTLPSRPGVSVSGKKSFEINTSVILLPEKPMRERFEDLRVGYFSFHQMDFDQNPQGVKIRSYIRRWKMEPRPQDAEKYKNGELVEPQKPIVFYIDPATPKKWIPYLMQGVNDWQKPFEQAGFKNAIVAKLAPTKEEDSTWSLYDARHSAIVYKPSDFENAAGNSIADPRTGEILESHINWYHNLMQLLHDQYMMACSVVDPGARKMVFDDSLMGKLIRYAIAHEVGHTLGLSHNMGSSSTVPVEKLRDKTWVEENGICPSIMDYARFNYVAQPEDGISEKGLISRIGIYDLWAIEWGYRWFPEFSSPEKEKNYLTTWTSQRLKDSRLWFCPQYSWDPRSQTNDLGDDQIAASNYGITNLKRMIPKLINWTNTSGESYENLNHVYELVQTQYLLYLRHVEKYIGGTLETIKFAGEVGPMYTPVPAAFQQSAFKFINQNQFQQPLWILDTAILSRTGQTGLGVMGLLNDQVIAGMVGDEINLYKIISRNQSTFGENTYTLIQFLDDLKNSIWTELYTHQKISLFRRNLQERYLKHIMLYLRDDNRGFRVAITLPISGQTELFPTDAIEMLRGQLRDIQQLIKSDKPFVKDEATRYHLEYINDQIELLNKK